MATVLDIEIEFKFSRGGNDSESTTESFNAADSSLQSTVDDRAEELLSDMNDDLDEGEDEWEYDGYAVEDFDGDWKDPDDFDDLDEYGAYAEKVEEHGFAYHARYDDIGDFDFDEAYNGEWASAEEFVQDLVEECYGLELPSFLYIDWERSARDVMMDYSEYDDPSGSVHIFRDC